jgi:hypothetical protein
MVLCHYRLDVRGLTPTLVAIFAITLTPTFRPGYVNMYSEGTPLVPRARGLKLTHETRKTGSTPHVRLSLCC